MKRVLLAYFKRKLSGVRFRSSSGLAVKEETVIDGVKFNTEDFEVNSANPVQNVRKQIYAWGLAEHGALGLEKVNNKNHKKSAKYKHKPARQQFGENNYVTLIESGYGFSAFAVKTRASLNKVFGCGLNTDSQLGLQEVRNGHSLGLILSPAPINLGLRDCSTDVVALSAGRAHLVVVTDKEGAFTLGSNCYGQCGRPIIENEKYISSSYVHCIKSLGDAKIVSAVCGQDHTLFLNEEGKVYSCGWGADGQTGLGTDENVSTPTLVCGDISSECIVKVVGKCDTVLALSNKGEVFGWGNTEYSQFTDGNDSRSTISCPVYIEKLRDVGKIVDIAAGGSFCMVLNEDGDVFVWGYGILGAGPLVDMSVYPTPLPRTLFGCNEFQPDSKVVAISCGLSHLAAVTNYCNLYTWGKNRSGCLGIGHIRDQYFPYKVCIGASVEQVSCGLDHTIALCSPFVIN